MITDSNYNFLSPAGREFVVAAARFGAVSPSSRILILGCGGGAGAVVAAREFRCRVVAADTRLGLAEEARDLCERSGVSHLVTVDARNPFEAGYADDPFDLVIAEGGFLRPATRKPFFDAIARWLLPRAVVAFADIIYTTKQVPSSVSQMYGDSERQTLSEDAYRVLVRDAGVELQFICLSPPSNWDNFYGHIVKRTTDTAGYFGSDAIKAAMNNEINLFYRMDCLRYIGYLICICRRD
ncbi:MAG: class I SAM-dependent methyltransferase [Chitinispirillales bacterium]|jgi:SAM-dependent methyltransferase|nr:class I SAM-dependent methyltransferase [Chitinispirillales bacterium]